ncbi:1,2-diacylglycerol 3-beta-glucosyltransferase [Kitasatospora sp. MAA4]|uniref:glycosyltransferase n=1 Tax=Kitasatospora sp. MAA4 TaxID=3035093 RepID=UPI002474A965|nr:glycosyltransferase [Kitasatospora sp. MAA4]MDH6136657.1 1,2-diacylglycerol 3-beta-glucosyltransferase [Kitasatospora sp. MAA4]
MLSDYWHFSVGLAQALALLMSTTFLCYVFIILRPYLRHKTQPEGRAQDFVWHLFVPCRDEAAVIDATLDNLLSAFDDAHVWVVDDASTDATAQLVRSRMRDCDRLHLVSRTFPEARQGKGPALNAAYAALDQSLAPDADRSKVIVGVIDADGRLSANCLDVCAAPHHFGDEQVGSVQVAVRMINRDDPRPRPGGRIANWWGRLLVRMQDLEFRCAISALQMTRKYTRTVGLGGNGQFSRLSALDDVRRAYGTPWHGALLEDYELGVHLMLVGHRNAYTVDALVDQEGLPDLRRLLTQRTRWGQGTMQCATYIPQLWNSRKIPTIGVLEATYYLLQPWMQIVGTVVYPVPMIIVAWNVMADWTAMSGWFLGGGWMLLLLLIAMGLGPFLLWGPIYTRRCEPGIGLLRGLGFGLAYTVFIATFYVTSWRALLRILQGRTGWSKTRRNAEIGHPGPVAVEA